MMVNNCKHRYGGKVYSSFLPFLLELSITSGSKNAEGSLKRSLQRLSDQNGIKEIVPLHIKKHGATEL